MISVVVLASLWVAGISIGLLLVVAVSYVIWFAVLFGLRSSTLEQEEQIFLGNELEHAYLHTLSDSFCRNLHRLQADFRQTQSLLDRSSQAVEQAESLAASTELAAANAIISASGTGELGRGFVSVAKDMVDLGKGSKDDIRVLTKCLNDAHSLLNNHLVDLGQAPETFFKNKNQLQAFELTGFIKQLKQIQDRLRGLEHKYRGLNQYDVRWSQLHDSISNLVKHLAGTLFKLEVSACEFLADFSLLNLSLSKHGEALLASRQASSNTNSPQFP